MPTEKKEKTHVSKEKRSKSSIIATTLIFISVMVILTVNTFCTLSICRPDIMNKIIPASSEAVDNAEPPMSNPEKVESSLLANGLSIIGMAVAVWAGLSIVNSISKKDFEKAVSDIENKITSAESKITLLKDESNDVKNSFQDLFLEEILKMPEFDIASKYFYRCFSSVKIPEELLNYFLKIEQLFYQVYTLHDNSANSRQILLEKIKQGKILIDGANEIKLKITDCSKETLEYLETYLDYRQAEFDFYKGYESGYESFLSSVTKFEMLLGCFGCKPMPDCNDKFIVPQLKEDNVDLCDLKVYLANTIGEAYSKVIQDYNNVIANISDGEEKIKSYANKAVFYCKCAVEWTGCSFKKPEVYYRNLGCAYERWDRIFGFGTHSKEIIENFQKAFELTRFDERPARIKNVYYSTLSYYHRNINTYCNLFPDNISIYLESNPNFDNNILSKIKEFHDYSKFGKLHLVKDNIPHVMNGFALSDIVIAKITNNEAFSDFTISGCMGQIEENLAILSLLNVDDDYTKELRRRYRILKEYLSETEQK